MEREPAVAGQFYPAEKKELKKQIDGFFRSIEKTHDKRVFGIIAPHAGYYYSGQCAAQAYNSISSLKFDTIIILGTKHSVFGKDIAVSMQDFKTPLGTARNDVEFSEKLADMGFGDETAHEYEHSIEVQIPFLQRCLKDPKNSKNSLAKKPSGFDGFMIVPIVIHADIDECKKLAKKIVSAARQLKRKICVIASSDFTHYGKSYGFTPFSGSDEEIKRDIYAIDKKAIEAICKMNSEKFSEIAGKTTICGASAIVTAIEACKMLGAKKGSLLKYCTSADMSEDYNTAVGYASIKFE